MSRALLPAACLLAPGCAISDRDHLRAGGSALLSDTGTAARGTLEVEAFGVLDGGEVVETPVHLNYGLTDTVELFASASPYTVARAPLGDEEGVGDLALGSTVHFYGESDRGLSFALQGGALVPLDEESATSTGELELFASLIGTHWWRRLALSATGTVGAVQNANGVGTDARVGGSLDAYFVIDDSWGVGAQVVTTQIPERGLRESQVGVGSVVALSPSALVDLGLYWGLGDDAPDAQAFLGLVLVVGD